MKKFDQFRRQLSRMDHTIEFLDQVSDPELRENFISSLSSKFMLEMDLAWKIFREILKYEGSPRAFSETPREIVKEAYRYFPFMDEGTWLQMLKDRSHFQILYDEMELEEYASRIRHQYLPELKKMAEEIESRYQDLFQTIA